MAKSVAHGNIALAALAPLTTTLSNGLRVVAAHLPSVHRVAITLHLRIGSRYESVENNGLSHLLEHMLYRGIPGYPTAHEQALAFETLGGTLVAGTGSDSGSLAISCPPRNFEQTLSLFGRVYREPLLGGLDVEKRIVREEILEDLDEDGTLVDDYDLLRAAAFEGHPLGMPVIGSVAHIDRFDVAMLRGHHDAYYVGAGSVIAVVGPMDPEDAVRAVEREFGAVPRGSSAIVSAPPPQTASRLRFVKHSSSQTALRVAFRGPGITEPSEPATELVLRILDDGNSTRLYTRLCDEGGLAYDVGAGYDATEDVGLLDIGCEMTHERATTVLGEILDVVKSLRDSGATDAEIAKAKARHLWGLEEMLDDPGELSEFLADAALRGYTRSPAERGEQIEAVDRAAIDSVMAKLFVPEALTSVIVGLQPKRTEALLTRLIRDFR